MHDIEEVLAIILGMGLPGLIILFVVAKWFRLKERKLEIEAGQVAEKAARYATQNVELEQRVRVLEQIVTDGGAETAAQIEALRKLPQAREVSKAS